MQTKQVIDQLEAELAELNINLTGPRDGSEDLVRGYGLETNALNEGYFGEGENDQMSSDYMEYGSLVGEDDEGGLDKPPEMPQDFYDEVDMFLKKEPPRIHIDDAGVNKKKGKPKKAKGLPISAQEQDSGVDTGEALKKKVKSKVAAYRDGSAAAMGANAGGPSRPIDPSLLKEAFDYTDKLLKDAMLEEAYEKQMLQQQVKRENKGAAHPVAIAQTSTHANPYGNAKPSKKSMHSSNSVPDDLLSFVSNKPTHPTSAPAMLPPTHPPAHPPTQLSAYPVPASQPMKKSNSMQAVKMVRNLKNAPKPSHNSTNTKPSHSTPSTLVKSDFQVMTAQETSKEMVNFEELVNNFTTGSTLEKLRRELAESQASLQKSEDVVMSLTGMKKAGGGGGRRK
eukprot:gene37358-45359_t